MSSVGQRDAAPLAALMGMRDQERQLAATKLELIARAREEGASWAAIGAALGVSKQAAWQLYNAEITALLDEVADRSGLTETEAQEIAREELAAARKARRVPGTR